MLPILNDQDFAIISIFDYSEPILEFLASYFYKTIKSTKLIASFLLPQLNDFFYQYYLNY
jgi:hypothetical protein